MAAALIPILVPLLTELLKFLAARFEKTPPKAALPWTTPLSGMALAPLMGVDEVTGAALGMAGSAVYEALKPPIRWLKARWQ